MRGGPRTRARVVTHQAFRFALDPTEVQRRALASHRGAARFAFNWALELAQAPSGVDVRLAQQARLIGLDQHDQHPVRAGLLGAIEIGGAGVEHSLTEMARELQQSLAALTAWAKRNQAGIAAARAAKSVAHTPH
jgi:Helix-turn-helix domain